MKQHEEISLDSAIRLQAQIHEHCLARGDSDLDWMLDFDGDDFRLFVSDPIVAADAAGQLDRRIDDDGAWIDLRIDPFTR